MTMLGFAVFTLTLLSCLGTRTPRRGPALLLFALLLPAAIDSPVSALSVESTTRSTVYGASQLTRPYVYDAELFGVQGRPPGNAAHASVLPLSSGNQRRSFSRHCLASLALKYDARQLLRVSHSGVATNTPIGFAPGAADDALSNIGRVDHSARNLLDQGVRQGTSGSKAVRSAFQDGARSILENPAQTFDHVMAQGGQRVKGFVGEINGQKVVVFVAKEARGKVAAGDLVTAIVPSPQQAANWGIR